MISWLGLVCLGFLARAAQVVEPPNGQLLLGAWLETDNSTQDTPVKANARAGFNFASFQFAQNIPRSPYNYTTGAGGPANFTFVELTGTDASIYLTVYPTGVNTANTTDWTILGKQILTYQSPPYNRSVFLRYAPEMNGDWFLYGMQPAQFVANWQAMHGVISSIAPDTAFVWSPNSGIGYPFSYNDTTPFNTTTAADTTALDTNGDGVLNSLDNAYSPYYPGDEYVDWVGQSFYWKGSEYPYNVNQLVDPEFYVRSMNGFVAGDTFHYSPFYSAYCTNKPCMLSECGAAWHVNDPPVVTQLQIQDSWMNMFWSNGTNSTFSQFPRIKMMQLFEQIKVEDDDDLRDYRLTNATDVLASFQSYVMPLIASGTILTANAAPVISILPKASVSALISGSATTTTTPTSAPAASSMPVVLAKSGAESIHIPGLALVGLLLYACLL